MISLQANVHIANSVWGEVMQPQTLAGKIRNIYSLIEKVIQK